MLPPRGRLGRNVLLSVLNRTAAAAAAAAVVVIVVVVPTVGFVVFIEIGLVVLVPPPSFEPEHLESIERLVKLGRPRQSGRLGHPFLFASASGSTVPISGVGRQPPASCRRRHRGRRRRRRGHGLCFCGEPDGQDGQDGLAMD